MMEYGTGGFRGVIMDDFNKENIKLIAQGLAEMIKQDHSAKPVYIGYDYRFGSEQAAIYMANTLAANHIQVYLSDQPSPALTFGLDFENQLIKSGIFLKSFDNYSTFEKVSFFMSPAVKKVKFLDQSQMFLLI